MSARSEAVRKSIKTRDASPRSVPEIREQNVTIPTPDGFPLAGTLFGGSADKPLVLISSATAVPRGLYSAFARAVVAQAPAPH
jgi:predicted alpha/beta hydrolase